jgi:hypothetical protein
MIQYTIRYTLYLLKLPFKYLSHTSYICTIEHSISVLKRIKYYYYYYYYFIMLQERLNSLTILMSLLDSLNYEDIIDDFSRMKSRKKKIYE